MPLIEEVDDDEIDNKHYSLEDFDAHNPFSKDTPVDEDAPVQLRPTGGPSSAPKAPVSASSFSAASSTPTGGPENISQRKMKINQAADLPEHMKKWPIIYPVYFDKDKTVAQGRRVPLEFAVSNPLATLMSDGCQELGYESALEITKCHPKDWANPGRVRVNLPEGTNKREIYGKLAKYLKANPPNSQNARENMYRQICQFDSMTPLPAPRNMKFPKILPGVSPALSAKGEFWAVKFSMGIKSLPTDAGTSKIKKRIRDLERLLNKPGLAATKKIEAERAVVAFKQELTSAAQRKVEIKASKKYHMVKFVEKKKAYRMLKKKDSGDEQLAAWYYITMYPKDKKYRALFAGGDEIPWFMREIKKKMESGELKKGKDVIEEIVATTSV